MQEKFLNRMTKNIGFMQGRLSPMDDGKIQSFPWKYWQNEFALASKYNFDLIEWTIDQHKICLLYTSPSPRDKRQSRMPSSA